MDELKTLRDIGANLYSVDLKQCCKEKYKSIYNFSS